jgi:long-chain acyl-CoA synthetase
VSVEAVEAGRVVVSVPEMFAHRVRFDGDAPFVLTPDGRKRTYSDLHGAASRLANALAHQGVVEGDVVAVYSWNSPSWIVATLATWSLGASIAACGGLTPPSEVQRRCDLVAPRLVVTAASLTPPVGLDSIAVDDEGACDVALPASGSSAYSPALDDQAAVFFTSGTTGESKPVVYTHQRFADAPRMTAGAYASTAEFRPRTAPGGKAPAISFNPFGHSAGMGRMVFRMFVGRTLLLVPKFDVAVLADLAIRYPIDTLQLTPAMIHSIAYSDLEITMPELKYVNSGTAPLPVATRERFETRFGVPVLQAYGSTEGGVTALERYDDALAGYRGPGSVGRVPANMPFRIVDANGDDVAEGREGELIGRVEQQQSPYLTSRGEDAIPLDADGWYHTGDVGHLDEHGILYITGRIKEMMIVGGFNVYPGEVEDALRRSRLVRDAVVVPRPDDRLGAIPVAGIVWDPAFASGDLPARLAAECRQTLEAYKIPRQWFTLDELPLTPNGKLDRLRASELAGAALGAVTVTAESD